MKVWRTGMENATLNAMKLIVSFKATIITERHAQKISSVPTDRYALSGETSIKPEEHSFKLE